MRKECRTTGKGSSLAFARDDQRAPPNTRRPPLQSLTRHPSPSPALSLEQERRGEERGVAEEKAGVEREARRCASPPLRAVNIGPCKR